LNEGLCCAAQVRKWPIASNAAHLGALSCYQAVGVSRLVSRAPFSDKLRSAKIGKSITRVGDLDRSEPACLKQIGELAERVGPGLQLKFRNGLTRVYLNEDVKCQTPEAEGCVKYRLAGYFPEHDLLLIEVGYWEDGSWLLVRADSGKTSEIVAPPHYSPSKHWLASVASSIKIGPSKSSQIERSVPSACKCRFS